MSEVLPPVTDKPKRARKAAPKKPRAPRTVPARTLRVRLAELGPHHVEAFDLVSKGDKDFADEVRDAMNAVERATVLGVELAMAQAKATLAKAAFDRAHADIDATSTTLARLNAKAALVAQLHDDTPEAEDVAI